MTHAPLHHRTSALFLGWTGVGLIAALAAASIALWSTPAIAQTYCIPRASGVPAASGPPVWIDANGNGSVDYPGEDDRLDDPRWRGTFAYGHPAGGITGSGAGEQVQFRAIQYSEDDTPYLYLSWVAKVAPTLGAFADARVFVGFHQPGASEDVLLEVSRTSSSPTTASSPKHSTELSPALYTAANGSDSWGAPTSAAGWMDASDARVWVAGVTSGANASPFNVGPSYVSGNVWGIQMRIPVAASGSPDAASPAVPIDPSSPFRLWYEVWVPINDEGGYTNVARYTFLDAPGTSASGFAVTFPDVSEWPEVRLASSATASGCTGDGVSLAYSNIGTTNTPPNRISLNTTNQFFARPTNATASAIDAGDIEATFRIANWGSLPNWNDVDDPAALWTEVPGGADRPNTGPIASGTTAGATNQIEVLWRLGLCERCAFENYYAANTATCNASCASLPAVKRRSHQCMLVEMQGAGLTFLNQSVYRNMDFVSASTFEREADVSVAGVSTEREPLAADDAEREVLLYVEKRNMLLEDDPVQLDTLDLPPGLIGIGRIVIEREPGGGQVAAMRQRDLLSERDVPLIHPIDGQLPTLRMHTYRDTGIRYRADEAERETRIFSPQTTYGYYVTHEEEMTGWRTAVEGDGLEPIAPRLYRARVPADGRITVSNVIQAVEPGEEPINEGDAIDRAVLDASTGGRSGVGSLCGSGRQPPGVLLLGIVVVGSALLLRRRRRSASAR